MSLLDECLILVCVSFLSSVGDSVCTLSWKRLASKMTWGMKISLEVSQYG